jgi:hypothetical protein
MSFLCKYKDAFGKVGTGAHSYRILNIAVVDVAITMIVAYAVAYYAKWPYLWTLFWFFIAGIIAHRLFCVRTTVDKTLFPE